MCIYQILFIHSSTDGIWVVSIFWLLWIMMPWIFVYKVCVNITFSSLLSIHLVVEMLSCMVTLFNFLRIYQVVFQSGCTILHFQKQSRKLPISLHPHQHSLLYFVLIIVFPVGVKWCVIVVLICISLMTNDVQNLFMCLLAICISFVKKYPFRPFVHF